MARKGKKSNSLGLIKDVLTLSGGLAGSILAIYGLVKTLRDDTAGFSWLILVGGGIWIWFLLRLFQTRRRAAYSLIIISVFAGVIGWVGWQSRADMIEDRVIVLVAEFDGPEDDYGLRRQMLEDLQEFVKDYDDTVIIEGDEVVTSSAYARELGEEVKADLVIWAWYRPTENPNITVHIENLSPRDFETIQESETYQPQATLAQLESFEIQRQLGSETSTLVSFLTGMLRYEAGDYETATVRFEKILEEDYVSTFISRYDLFFNLGYSYTELGDYEGAIRSYNKAIEINPELALAYSNRGTSYGRLGQVERSIEDFDKAIEINPELELAYFNLGGAYGRLGQYERAIEKYDKVIEINPEFVDAYNSRGVSCAALGQNERAIEEYDKAIEINPEYVNAYYNRGVSYDRLRQYERATEEYAKAIEINPEFAEAYFNRGITYGTLGQYERAIEDFDKAIEINPEDATAYSNRGVAYVRLGKIAEAMADFERYEELTGEKP
jgi:tetratricopeptide (TPR) repeat protein